MDLKLKEKVVLVTGGSRGIGRELCLSFAKEGAKVAVNYSSSPQKAEEVVALINDMGGFAKSYKANVSSGEEVEQMFSQISEDFGDAPEILVNNAGITKDTLMNRMSEEDFDSVLDVNLKGAFICCKQALKSMMKKRYGKIINMSSIIGTTGNAGQANYAASKGGLVAFTKSIAQEYAKRGIRANAVAPGFISSEMTEILTNTQKENIMGNIPLKAMGEPQDIADAVLYLASPISDYVTGQTLHVNGGLIMV